MRRKTTGKDIRRVPWAILLHPEGPGVIECFKKSASKNPGKCGAPHTLATIKKTQPPKDSARPRQCTPRKRYHCRPRPVSFHPKEDLPLNSRWQGLDPTPAISATVELCGTSLPVRVFTMDSGKSGDEFRPTLCVLMTSQKYKREDGARTGVTFMDGTWAGQIDSKTHGHDWTPSHRCRLLLHGHLNLGACLSGQRKVKRSEPLAGVSSRMTF